MKKNKASNFIGGLGSRNFAITEEVLDEICGMRLFALAAYMRSKIDKGHSVNYAAKETELFFANHDRKLKEKYLKHMNEKAIRVVNNSVFYKCKIPDNE